MGDLGTLVKITAKTSVGGGLLTAAAVAVTNYLIPDTTAYRPLITGGIAAGIGAIVTPILYYVDRELAEIIEIALRNG